MADRHPVRKGFLRLSVKRVVGDRRNLCDRVQNCCNAVLRVVRVGRQSVVGVEHRGSIRSCVEGIGQNKSGGIRHAGLASVEVVAKRAGSEEVLLSELLSCGIEGLCDLCSVDIRLTEDVPLADGAVERVRRVGRGPVSDIEEERPSLSDKLSGYFKLLFYWNLFMFCISFEKRLCCCSIIVGKCIVKSSFPTPIFKAQVCPPVKK